MGYVRVDLTSYLKPLLTSSVTKYSDLVIEMCSL